MRWREIIAESRSLAEVTPETVIEYCRDPRNKDVHPVYVEQIDFAFDGDQAALDAWITGMVDYVKAKVTKQVRTNRFMYRGFKSEPQNPLGVHWTTDESIAKMFAQNGVVLKALVNPDIVDWLGTIVRGIFWDNDAEDELYLIKGAKITFPDGTKRPA